MSTSFPMLGAGANEECRALPSIPSAILFHKACTVTDLRSRLPEGRRALTIDTTAIGILVLAVLGVR